MRIGAANDVVLRPSLGEVRSAWKEKDQIQKLVDDGLSNQDVRKAMGFFISDTFFDKMRNGEL